MKNNMGTADRVIRVLLSLTIGVMLFQGAVSGLPSILLGIVAVILLVTGLVSFCPLYALIGLSTGTKQAPPAGKI